MACLLPKRNKDRFNSLSHVKDTKPDLLERNHETNKTIQNQQTAGPTGEKIAEVKGGKHLHLELLTNQPNGEFHLSGYV